LLFLRHVERIEVFSLDEKDTAPVLQYSVEVTKRDPSSGWQTVPDFVSGSPRRPLSKEAFYSKLGQTPDASLPKVEQLVEITFRQEAKASQREIVSGSTGEAGSPSTMVEGASSKSVVDVFLVCVAIGGKEAKKMAC
ncbi:unnamed protein product, partial [Sphacelaria rigidula]